MQPIDTYNLGPINVRIIILKRAKYEALFPSEYRQRLAHRHRAFGTALVPNCLMFSLGEGFM